MMLGVERARPVDLSTRLPTGQEQSFVWDSFLFRSFGLFAVDLEIDFAQTLKPYLETQILTNCVKDREGIALSPDFVWSLAISKRTEYLLLLITQGGAVDLKIAHCCLNPQCQQTMEITIGVDQLIQFRQQAEAEAQAEITLGGQSFFMRRPTGRDQLKWLEHSFPDYQSAVRAIVETLLPEEQKAAFQTASATNPEWIERFNQTMEALDPWINFNLQVVCPYCGSDGQYPLDLGAWSLQKLYETQQRLIESVHRMATYYHWTEAEIFSLSPWRRARYLTLIEREVSG